jgi:hypothetical protein
MLRRKSLPGILYQLADDIAEATDLAGERPEKVRELIQQWHALDQQMREPFFGSTR